MKTVSLGEIHIDRIVEFEQPLLLPSDLLPTLSSEQLENHRDWLEPHLLDPHSGRLVLSLHSFLVRTPKLNILIDTCSGNHKNRPHKLRYHQNQWPYLERLRATGVDPEQIDLVLCTHLHLDHVGWNTRLVSGQWVPTFPNAKYLFGLTEWNFWSNSLEGKSSDEQTFLRDSLLPIFASGQAQLVGSSHAINDEIWFEPAPGHTPGHICVHIKTEVGSAVISGDIMHHPLQCAEPNLSTCFCIDPVLAAKTRREFLQSHADKPITVLPAHFPSPTAGRVISAKESFRFVFDDGGDGTVS